jgi:hypothetical protein
LRLVIGERLGATGRKEFWVQEVGLRLSGGWQPILSGVDGKEFSTSLGDANATHREQVKNDATGVILRMSCHQEAWEGEETIEMVPSTGVLKRKQTYRFLKPCEGSVHPGFRVKAQSDIRYTYPMWIHEQPLTGATPMGRPVDWADGGEAGVLRQPADWAVPLPVHIWHDRRYVALYGLDKSVSPGTLDFTPAAADGLATLRVYYPDSFPEAIPGTTKFAAGATLTFTEVIAAKPLAAHDEPLLEAERMAATILLRTRPHAADLNAVAQGLEDYFKHCELWEPNALGPGRGWFDDLWLHVAKGHARKTGVNAGAFDLGWADGEAVYFWSGAVSRWKRTRDASLLPYVDEMTRNIDFFKRGNGPDALYFDRWDGKHLGDYSCTRRIWTHSVGEVGCILVQLYQSAPDYPNAETRRHWLAAATAIGNFLARHQKPDGDLQDIFDDNDKEGNTGSHRCSGRIVVCGLWTRLGQVTCDEAWIGRAMRLARAVAPEIKRYEFYNEMTDHCLNLGPEWIPKHRSPRPVSADCVAGDAGFRALEGLVPLYAATRDREVLALCKASAAYGFAWTYFYDIPAPKTLDGIARGGQCCCNHFPAIFVIGPEMAMEPLLSLAKLTGDPIYEQMAGEMASYIGNSQLHRPGKPWNGALIQAFAQNTGKYWEPNSDGAVDTGMSSGNGLAAIEAWLARDSGQLGEARTRDTGHHHHHRHPDRPVAAGGAGGLPGPSAPSLLSRRHINGILEATRKGPCKTERTIK